MHKLHYPHYYATTSPVSSVRTRDWKLMEYYEDGNLELYNLADDPGEQHNLAAAWLSENKDRIPL